MKYSIEIENGVAKETLVFNNKEYTRTTATTDYGSSFVDMEFSEQMENEGLSDDTLNKLYDTLGGFFVSNLLDIADQEKNPTELTDQTKVHTNEEEIER